MIHALTVITYWTAWLALTLGLAAILIVFGDPIGYRPRHARPSVPVAAAASVAAVLSSWQPRISRIP